VEGVCELGGVGMKRGEERVNCYKEWKVIKRRDV
jgi:hypothetical protein